MLEGTCYQLPHFGVVFIVIFLSQCYISLEERIHIHTRNSPNFVEHAMGPPDNYVKGTFFHVYVGHKMGVYLWIKILEALDSGGLTKTAIGLAEETCQNSKSRISACMVGVKFKKNRHSRDCTTEPEKEMRGTANGAPTIIVIRDPRDVIISSYLYHLWCPEDWLNETMYCSLLQQLPVSTGIQVETNLDKPPVFNAYSTMANTARLVNCYGDMDSVVYVRFEDVLAKPRKTVGLIFQWLAKWLDFENVGPSFSRRSSRHLRFSNTLQPSDEWAMNASHAAYNLLAKTRVQSRGVEFDRGNRNMLGLSLISFLKGHHIQSGKRGQYKDWFGPKHYDDLRRTGIDQIVEYFGY
mmetsp:Transcript_9597/g.26903  ORF Transcript_9597/g.26903 Transcript_9597/m.26903 type:complete len:352 (-) Transcript_9597:2571-3626(-)